MKLPLRFFFLLLPLGAVLSFPAFPLAQEATAELSAAERKAAEKLYGEGRRFLQEEYYDLAVETFEKFLSDYPQHDRLPEVYFLLGQANVRLKRDAAAIEFFKKIVQEHPGAPFAPEARRQLGRIYLQVGMLKEAIATLEQQAALTEDVRPRAELYSQVASLYLIDRQPLKSIETLLKERSLTVEDQERLLIAGKIRRVIENQLTEPQLKQLSERYPRSFPGDEALFRLGKAAYEKEDLFGAEGHLRRFAERFPRHAYRREAAELLDAVRRRQEAYRFRIGVLLPLSGPQAPYAESVLKGLRLAMSQARFMLPEGFAGLVIRDYGEGPKKLKEGLEQLDREYEAVALIGPLLSRDVETVAPLVQSYQIPLISPTASASQIALENAYVFRNAVPFRLQGKALVEHAMLQFGLRRFVIFYQDDSLGLETMKVLAGEIGRLGGELVTVEGYAPDANDFAREIRHVMEVDLSRYGTLLPPADPASGERPEYVPGFDAVFLQGDPLKTGLLAAQLVFHGIQDRMLFVADGEDVSKFISAGERFAEGAFVVKGFFEGSEDPAVREFVDLYRSKYQEMPDIFAAQAYDCARLILLALQQGAKDRNQIRDYLAQVRAFRGASGLTSLHPSGRVQKRLFVLQIRGGKLVQVN